MSVEEPCWRPLETPRAVVGRSTSTTPPAFYKTVNVYNHLNCEVVITARDDVPFHCPPRVWSDNHLYVVITYTVNQETNVDPYGDFYHSYDSGHMAAAFRQAIEKQQGHPVTGGPYRTFTITYSFSKEELDADGDSVYVMDLDWVVNIGGRRHNNIHPYAPTAARMTMMNEELNHRFAGAFSFSAYIVSNDESISDRFMRIGDMVYRIPSIVNHSQRDGFYICAASPKKGQRRTAPNEHGVVRKPEYEFLDIESAARKYRLYLTRELAETLGDPEAERSREIKQIQRDLEEQKARNQRLQEDIKAEEAERERLRHAREEEARKRESERKEREAKEEDFRRERERWRKEQQSDRQNTQEIIKFIPVVIGTVLTITSLILRNK